MARFRLNGRHYLNCPGTEWEQVEVGATGKQVRHRYAVHRLLDPDDPADHTPPGSNEVLVTTKEDPRYPHDILFVGPPSNEMTPLDDEAERLVARVLARGVAPMSEAAFPTTPVITAPKGPDPMAEMRAMMAELRGEMTLLSAQNAELQARLDEKTAELESLEPAEEPETV